MFQLIVSPGKIVQSVPEEQKKRRRFLQEKFENYIPTDDFMEQRATFWGRISRLLFF